MSSPASPAYANSSAIVGYYEPIVNTNPIVLSFTNNDTLFDTCDANFMNPKFSASISANNDTLLSTGYTSCTNSLNPNARAKKKSESEQSAAKIKELEKTIEDLKKENSSLWIILNRFKEFLNFEVAQLGDRINHYKEILNFEIAQLGNHIINRFKEFLNLEVAQLGDRINHFIKFELETRYKS
ncbi:18770_t:CDS:2 [Gigaspora rosea]|nr:18770_t:CDS:2 [Gigaspora rosea]